MTLRTKGLIIGSYSPYQVELSNKVIHLRDIQGLTFKLIAEQLINEGYKSPRGFDLGPESVFSIYKKRKIRDTRLNNIPEIIFSKIEIVYL